MLALLISALSGALLGYLFQPPPPSRLQYLSHSVLASDGTVLARRLSDDGFWREAAALEEIDPRLIDLLIAYEDRRFWRHQGVDWLAVLRAGKDALFSGSIRSGASTITMQTVRLLYPELGRKTATAKLKQMMMALRLEQHWSKQQILQAYFTLAPYGSNIEGIATASQAWLGRAPKQLSWREASLLVALPQSPERRRPDRYPEAAAQASARVLQAVAAQFNFTTEQLQEWRSEPLPLRIRAFAPGDAHLIDRLSNTSGGAVPTSIHSHWQGQARQALEHALQQLSDQHNGALLLVQRQTGAIQVYLGSGNYQHSQRKGAINYLTTLRSTGSTLKPLIYGLALQRGMLQPNSLLRDGEIQIDGYRPSNFDDGFYGQVSLQQALQHSLNIPAITTLERLDANLVTRQIEQFLGLPAAQLNDPGLALAVGAAYLSAEQLANLYLGLTQQQAPRVNFTSSEVSVRDGLLNASSSQQLLSLMAIQPAASNHHSSQAPVQIYKTGTSNGRRDAWSVHITAEHLLVVWLGAPDNQSSDSLSGASHAAPLGLALINSLQLASPANLSRIAAAEKPRPSTSQCPRLIEFPEHDEWVISSSLSIRVGSRYTDVQWYVNGQRSTIDDSGLLTLPSAGAHSISARQGDCVTSHSIYLQLHK